MTTRIHDVIIPGSIRVEHVEYDFTRMTVRCGRCGHEQEANADGHTATCKACGRTMRLDQALPAGENVVPIRRRA